MAMLITFQEKMFSKKENCSFEELVNDLLVQTFVFLKDSVFKTSFKVLFWASKATVKLQETE